MLKLRAATVTGMIALSFIFSSLALGAEVTGRGIHRNSEQSCKASLPAFQRRLKNYGIQVALQDIRCKPSEEDSDAYEPVFKGTSSKALVTETAETIWAQNEASCEQKLRELSEVVVEPGERILEQGCVPLTIVDPDTGEAKAGQFQPTIVLLKSADNTTSG